MRHLLAVFLGLGFAANGAAMLLVPLLWYAGIPGVADTGPFNPHFVRDIGCAYFVSGTALIGFALDRRFGGAALAGAAFLALHAAVHLWDAAAGRESLDHLIWDLPAVFIAPALALWVAWPRSRNHKEINYAQMADRTADRRL